MSNSTMCLIGPIQESSFKQSQIETISLYWLDPNSIQKRRRIIDKYNLCRTISNVNFIKTMISQKHVGCEQTINDEMLIEV